MRAYKVIHLFCGIGGAALGMQQTVEEYRGMVGKFQTLAGIDCDPAACQDFEMLTGAPAVQMDLFSRDDYKSFHGQEPPVGWREVTADDLRLAVGPINPDVVFTSPPCKGFSGLLPSKSAASEKYQALNRLTVRGMRLILEAFADDLPGIIMLENVPRITTRGTALLDEIKRLLKSQGYLLHEGYHDCGEIGGLGQRRKRYLLIARHPDKIKNFIYQPPQLKLKSIGEVIGPLPMPDVSVGGDMHRLPRLQWKTWVRLALIPAGGDWRDLEKITPKQYRLEHIPRNSSMGVMDWDEPSGAVIGNARVGGSQASAIADPRLAERESRHPGVYRVVSWEEHGPCITGTRFGSGSPAIADPRTGFKDGTHTAIYRVSSFNEPARTVTGAHRPNNGSPCIADPRVSGGYSNKYQLFNWSETATTVTGTPDIQSGARSIADPRLGCKCRNGSYGVQVWDKPGNTVTSADIHAGPVVIADPRIPEDSENGTWIIIAPDGTWHRPLTTWELMALQGFPLYHLDGSPIVLSGNSDAKWRERIGNAVPPPAAKAVGEQIMRAFLLNEADTWELSTTPIWVMPEQMGNEVVLHD